MNSKLLQGLGLSVLTAFGAIETAHAQTVLFSDDFETNSASRWAIYSGQNASDTFTNDYVAVFSTNYGAMTYQFNGATLNIPPAPHSSGTTYGLYVTANKKNPTTNKSSAAGVSLYPIGMSFSNNFALRFDMWMDYNGDTAGGGTGSTEFATFGVDHTANEVNWGLATTGDGIWFAMDADAGTTVDYRMYAGPTDAEVDGPGGGFYDRNGDGSLDQGADYTDFSTNNPFIDVYPVPPGQTPGGAGKRWSTVEVKQQNGVITWSLNGFVIASANYVDQGFTYTAGDIMLGYMDTLAGVAKPANQNYAIFDNVQVVDLGTNAPVPSIAIYAQGDATKPGGAGNSGSFLLNVTDDTGAAYTLTAPLAVSLQISGTASNGLDYTTVSNVLTIPAGVSSTTITIAPTSRISDPSDSVVIQLAGSTNYLLRANTRAAVSINDPRGNPGINVQAYKPVAYEKYAPGKFNISATAAPTSDLTVSYTISGTAVAGVDYTNLPASVVIPAGTTNVILPVYPIDNAVIDSNRTVILTIGNGANYHIGNSSNATVTLVNDDLSSGTVLFSDNFETTNSVTNWSVNLTEPTDLVTFGYDYSADGVPPAPHTTNGTTLGVKMQVNYSAGVAAALSLSPLHKGFTGDYRMRFDMWLNYNGGGQDPITLIVQGLPGGGNQSTEFFSAGVGTTGDHPQSYSGSDGIWFDVDTDAASTIASDYEAYLGTNEFFVGPNSVYVCNSQSAANSYYNQFGLESAPAVQTNAHVEQINQTLPGCVSFAWHDVVVTKQGTNVTWAVDGLPIAIVPITSTISTNVFFGFIDPSSGSCPLPDVMFALVDNFKVENLAPTTPPAIGTAQSVGSNIQFAFTGTASDTTSSFKVQSSATVTTGFADDGSAVITQTGSGTFSVTIPKNGAVRFYRVRR